MSSKKRLRSRLADQQRFLFDPWKRSPRYRAQEKVIYFSVKMPLLISTFIRVCYRNVVKSSLNMLLSKTPHCDIHWASKETYHFFRATLIKIQSIKMNHNWTQISYSTPYQAHLKNQMFDWVKRERHKVISQEVIFQNSQKLLASRARGSTRTIASAAVTA